MVGDRERIDAEIADRLVNHLFVAGLALNRALAMTNDAQVRENIDVALTEIDTAIQGIRIAAMPSRHPEDEADSSA